MTVNHTVLYGSADGSMYKFTSEGTVAWTRKTGTLSTGNWGMPLRPFSFIGAHLPSFASGDWVQSSPAVGTKGLVVFGSYDKNIYGLDVMTGERVFTVKTKASPGRLAVNMAARKKIKGAGPEGLKREHVGRPEHDS